MRLRAPETLSSVLMNVCVCVHVCSCVFECVHVGPYVFMCGHVSTAPLSLVFDFRAQHPTPNKTTQRCLLRNDTNSQWFNHEQIVFSLGIFIRRNTIVKQIVSKIIITPITLS